MITTMQERSRIPVTQSIPNAKAIFVIQLQPYNILNTATVVHTVTALQYS